MKKILSLIGTFSLIVPLTSIAAGLTNQVQESILLKPTTLTSKKTNDNNDPSIDNFYIPTHEEQTIYVNKRTEETKASIQGIGQTWDETHRTVSFSFNFLDYAANKTDFQDKFSRIRINASMIYTHTVNGVHNSKLWGSWIVYTYSSLPKDEKDKTFSREHEGESSNLYIETNLSWNSLEITLTSNSWVWKPWGIGGVGRSASTVGVIDSIDLLPTRPDETVSKIHNKFSSTYTISSVTSHYIDSIETKNLLTGINIESNYKKVNDLIDELLKTVLGIDYNAWMERISVDKIFNRDSKTVTLIFSDKYGYSYVKYGKFPSKETVYINVIFNNTYAKTIKNTFAQQFIFDSDTSPNANDESHDSDLGKVISNKEKVEAEVKRRVNSLFKNQAWSNSLSYDTSYQNSGTSSIVQLIFSDNKPYSFIENGQWPKEVIMPVSINLTKAYYAGGLKRQLEVKPGKIVKPNDPSNPQLKNVLMEDHPSYDLKTKTYTYHNSVDLTFSAKTDTKQELEINGERVQVLDNIFRTRLNDKRNIDSKSETKPSQYNVKLYETKNNVTTIPLSFNIIIDAVTDQVEFKQWGWDPQEADGVKDHYDQWLLTQEKVKDEFGNLVDNESYNPLINIETGLINNYVFIKGKDKYPFAQDQLDSNGKLIKNTDLDKEQRTNYGYIAQAETSSQGFGILNPIAKDNIDHIERWKLDEASLEEIPSIGNTTNLDLNDTQFSLTGLWHYVIYQKNYVAKKLDPKEINSESALSKGGGVIHKLVYIDKGIQKYGDDFLNTTFAKRNERIVPFWNTIQATHLKQYLTSKQIDTENIQSAKYENIISYWYDYVSDVQSNNIIPKTGDFINLEKAEEIPAIKLNTDSEQTIKNRVSERIKLWMNRLTTKAIYGTDYIISDTPSGTKILNNINLSKLANKEIEQQELFVIAKPISTILIGIKKFTVFNSQDFDEPHSFDLSVVWIPTVVKNFSKISFENLRDAIIKQNLNDKIEKELSSARVEANYNEDYFYSLQGIGGVELDRDESLEQKLKDFISTDQAELKVTAYAAPNSNKIQGATTLTLINSDQASEPDWGKIDIKIIFKQLDLGEIFDTNKNGYIDNQEIWNSLVIKNNLQTRLDLVMYQFIFQTEQISDDGQFKSEIYAKETNPKYKGHITVFFTTTKKLNPENKKTNINDLFINLDLGEINDLNGNHLIDDEDIWIPLVQKNNLQVFPHLKMKDFTFKVNQTYDFNYTVLIEAKPDNEYFEGNVTSYFSAHFKINPDLPDSEHDGGLKNDSQFNNIDLAWILPLLFIGIGVTSFTIYWMMKRKKSKKTRMK